MLTGAALANTCRDFASSQWGTTSEMARFDGASGRSTQILFHSDNFDALSGHSRGDREDIRDFFSAEVPHGKGVSNLFTDHKISHFIAKPEAVRVVPEPGTLALMGTGLIAIASRIRRKLRA